MVLGGLALFTVTRVDNLADVVPLWIGAIAGSLLGQFLALHDFRMWLAALIVGFTGLYCGPLVPTGDASSQLWLAFIPAAACGFLSLRDRSALAALWFPAVLWMLAILDRNEQQFAPDGVAAILLGGLALLFVWFLHARESRRVGLWRTVSPEPLAPVRPPELLREPPGHQLARAAWGLTIGAIAIALTVWLAPPLWRAENLGGDEIELAAAPIQGMPCCPLHQRADTESTRVREYLDLGLGHDVHTTTPRENIDCRVCEPVVVAAPVGEIVEGVPGVGGPTTEVIGAPVASEDIAEPVAPGNTAWQEPAPTYEPIPPQHTPSPAAGANPSTPRALPPPPEPPPAPPLAAKPPVASPPPPPAAPATSHPGASTQATTRHRNAAEGIGASLLRWLILAAIAALLFQLVRFTLRPLRRLVTLRHLRRPFWDETVDQRVSNSWQLALIGLRDAGWRAGVTEAPGELARRVQVDGLDRCAAILERARHGVGLDTSDLGEMATAADIAYHAARATTGGFARAIGWLRWPLT
jgi:hypothetical protein